MKWIVNEKEGVVVSSDSKVTVGPISYETRKVYPIYLTVGEDTVPLAIAGGAGDASIIKQSYRICENILKNLASKEWNNTTPTYEQFEDAVNRIESTLISRFRALREEGLNISFNMILASVDSNGKASIYTFDERGLAEPVHDNPGFAVIGTGFFTGGNLLLRLLGYDHEDGYALDIGMLSTFIIDIVSEIDPAVGSFVGESYYMRVDSGNVVLGTLKEEAIKEYKEKARQRKEVFRRIWRMCDVAGEQKVLKKIEELEEEEQKEEVA
ncbi:MULTISPECIES: hypothetical protein [Candidatus Nitrosocaldus]|uniref:hypothetical protein n=1 Tax=Candidatus Nitrosocaldus TaxID=498374 RepID=UPI000CD21559|nr:MULTISPECIES: hypothetical protein [Candidatus Nitrosocaldus]